jgi:hypothetical protein
MGDDEATAVREGILLLLAAPEADGLFFAFVTTERFSSGDHP